MVLRLGDDHYLCMDDHRYGGGMKHTMVKWQVIKTQIWQY